MKYKQHGKSYTRLYRIWTNMKKRCYNPNVKCYKHYGGKGIKVCHRWRYDFEAFEKWALTHGYADNLTIDRIDINKGYQPTNCQWITRSENSKKDCVFNYKNVAPEEVEYRKALRRYGHMKKMYDEAVEYLIEEGKDPSTLRKPVPPKRA